MNKIHKLFATLLIGDIIGWAFLPGSNAYPVLSAPILIIWLWAYIRFIKKD